MSNQPRHPPPPRGNYRAPPPPQQQPRDNRNDRDARNRGRHQARDAFRPPSYAGRHDRDSRYTHGGSSLPPPSGSYPGPPGVDSYRPPQSDFTFRVDKPAGVKETDSYRPQNNRGTRRDRREPHSPRRDSRPAKKGRASNDRKSKNGAPARPLGGENRFEKSRGGRPWRPFIAAERELLKADHHTGSELAYFDTTGGVTYRPLEDLSDSDDAEMDISEDDAEGTAEPSSKRARLSAQQSTSDNNAPKWSNPDPYTALPPESAPRGKKKDVVQMIRKARIPAKEVRDSLPSEAADFISFDLDESDDNEPLPTARTVATMPGGRIGSQRPSKGAVPAKAVKTHVLLPDPTPSALGTRKRTHDDEIKTPHTKLKKSSKAPVGGGVISEWLAVPGVEPTPWMKVDHSDSANVAVWLHKEIIDFYNYVKPRAFEERLRSQVVQDLKNFCREAFKDGEVYPFGSFPSGLYLPTSDIDMAFLSDRYVAGGEAKYSTKNFLYRFKGHLTNHKMAWNDEIELIVGAKVPLVKFVDHKTGLRVDVSFENNTGLTAIDTFKAWKDQYPGMPALVMLIKHFLLMRGLNEPVNGGIGGFSVICLVASMLQMMPEVQSGNLDTRHHLGQLLLHFLDLYGNRFNYQTVAVSLNPPQWIPKHQVTAFAYKNHNRLSIIDPNNPANDIAGGSSNAGTVMSLFSLAHKELTRHMTQLAQDPNRRGKSILGVILGGNYSSFQKQRDYLERLAK